MARYRWDGVERRLVQCDREEVSRTFIVGDSHHEGARAPDGTLIDTKKKRREYLKRSGLSEPSDYGPDWGERVKAEADRAESKALRTEIERVWNRKARP